MFKSLFGKKEEQPKVDAMPILLQLRETLYTNASLEPFLARLQPDALAAFPWSNFAAANQALKEGDQEKAVAQLKEIVGTPEGLDTRIRLQAWHTLVSLGQMPVDTLRGYTQGVIIENHTDQGLDILAAYIDYSARYWDHSGAGVIWDARDREIDQLIFNLLSVAFEITKRIGVGLRDMPPPAQKGYLRIFIMAYDGSTVGEELFVKLSKDPMGIAALTAANKLIKALMAKRGSRKSNDIVAFRAQ